MTAKTIRLRIDGREVSAAEGTFVLEVARSMGIDIPTLCDDPALEPVGACRLCMVEVTHPDWNGWTGLMTSCLYPVAEGLEISTASENVLRARRQVLSLFAARCPNSAAIQELADQHGVVRDGLLVDEEADDCILCGLCTRVCESYATSAITTYNRGATKAIGAFGEDPPDDCVGCGACAMVCPTDNIPAQRTSTGFEIWGRDFETSVAVISRTRCLGCGSCEEACPFHVARVALHPDGRRVAVIPREHCRGCGACVGACPSGAIDQEHYERATLLEKMNGARIPVFACGRSDLGRHEMPAGVLVVDLPCTGRISGTQLLAGVLRGGDGALVLGRHQETCRLDGAEDPVLDLVDRIRTALLTVGFQEDRIRFTVPDPGPAGPMAEVRDFLATVDALGDHPLDGPAPAGLFEDEGLDTQLAVFGWLSGQEGLEPNGTPWLKAHDLPVPQSGKPALCAGVVPYLSILADPLFAPLSMVDVLSSAVEVLEHLGFEDAGVQIGGCGVVGRHQPDLLAPADRIIALTGADAEQLTACGIPAEALDTLLLGEARALPKSTYSWAVACDGSDLAVALIEALGHTPIDLGPDPLPAGFRISPVLRNEAEQRLQAAEAAGAETMLVTDPLALARWAMITRQGAWRSSRVTPVLAHQLFLLAARGVAPTLRALENPPLGNLQPVGGAS